MNISENRIFIGIDTSNYTTSVAVASDEGEIIANLKIPLEVTDGERGLRQSDAVFAHVKNLPRISDELRQYTVGKSVAAVGCSSAPRDALGSYMPCFLSGQSAASMMAASADVPLYLFSHQAGHIAAAVYSSGFNAGSCNRFAAFHVSGGTTEVMLVSPNKSADDSSFNLSDVYRVQLLGGTRDLNAGQVIDRAGVMMGFKFPCGRELEKNAIENEKKIPHIKTSVDGFECNLSGLENKAAQLYAESGDKRLTSSYVLEFIAETIMQITEKILSAHGSDIPLLYAGGVMSCSIIKNKLGEKFDCHFAQPEFSSDNAAGTALMCKERYLTGREVAKNGGIRF